MRLQQRGSRQCITPDSKIFFSCRRDRTRGTFVLLSFSLSKLFYCKSIEVRQVVGQEKRKVSHPGEKSHSLNYFGASSQRENLVTLGFGVLSL